MSARALAPLSSFVGRGPLLAEVRRAFDGGERLVTLVGPPGIGKTRVALRFLEREALERGSRATFCDLSATRHFAEACAAVCAALGLVEPTLSTPPATSSLAVALAARGSHLLVLDNFEQLAEEAGELATWCAEAPALRLLVTSRERLRVPGERVVEVGPLGLPAAGASGEDALATEAATLFLERASAVSPGEDRSGHGAAIGALVRALDGIPLAIELAAARASTLAPAEMLSRLSSRFEVLRSDARPETRAERHATLRAAVDWSWQLLAPDERSLLAQCSVFEGGFSLEAAERVVEARPLDGRPVLEALGALCDKSLVTTVPDGASRRFGMFASIRDYARSKLEPAAASRVEARHTAYFVACAEEWAGAVARRADPQARDALQRERENLLSVLRRATAGGRAAKAIGVRVAVALYPVLESRGPFDDLVALLEAAVGWARDADVPAALRARVLFARGNTYGFRGRLDESLSDLSAALEAATASDDPALIGEAYVWLSVRYRHAGRFDEAVDACDRAEALLSGKGYPRLVGLNLAVRGLLRGELGLRAESRVDNERAMAIFRHHGDRWYEGLTLANLAQLAMHEDDLEQARRRYGEALDAFRAAGEPRYEARYLGYLACVDWQAGDEAAAEERLARAIQRLDEVRTDHYAALFRAVRAGVLACLGRVAEASDEVERALGVLSSAGTPSFAAAGEVYAGQVDVARARVAMARGEVASHARHVAVAEARAATAKALTQSRSGRPVPLVDCSDDLRFSLRMLDRSLGSIRVEVQPFDLVIGREGRWFSVAGRRTDLERRGPIRRILVALAEERCARPGAALAQSALLRVGWPGERVLPEAGSKRVRVAVSTLRSMGLQPLLVTRDDGYLLSPACRVALEAR